MGRQFCLQIAKVFGGQQTNLHPGGLELGSYQVHQCSAEAPLESKKKKKKVAGNSAVLFWGETVYLHY